MFCKQNMLKLFKLHRADRVRHRNRISYIVDKLMVKLQKSKRNKQINKNQTVGYEDMQRMEQGPHQTDTS